MAKHSIASVARLKDAEIIGEMASGSDLELRHAALKHPKCKVEILTAAARRLDGDAEVALSNPSMPSDVLGEILDRMKDDWCCRAAAKNENAPPAKALAWMMRFDNPFR